MSIDRFFIDFFVAWHRGLVQHDVLRHAFATFLERDKGERLSEILEASGRVDSVIARQIDSEGDACRHSLAQLAMKPGEEIVSLSEPPNPDSQIKGPSELPSADAFEGVYETFMEPADGLIGGRVGVSSGEPPRTLASSSGSSSQIPTRESRYKKQQPHAAGGLGEVWVASDIELGRKVALKEIQSRHADHPVFRQRFTKEAEITGTLEHPGIVPVYGLGYHPDGRPYYAMRFIEGETLTDAIDSLHRNAPMRRYRHSQWSGRMRKLIKRLVDVCNTIEYAHSKNIIHRDIKPSNIMLGSYGETLVVDWGLAKRLGIDKEIVDDRNLGNSEWEFASASDPQLTVQGAAVGTPSYMSPEQASGGRTAEITRQTDVYSLGATLYHLLTGKPLCPSLENGPAGIHPSAILRDIPPPLDSICAKALAADPNQRYLSAADLAADIDRWGTNQPVLAHRESGFESMSRWIRNYPTLAASLLLATIFVSAATIVGVIGYNNYHQEIFREQQERNRLAQAHLQRVSSAAQSAVATAKIELKNGRFQSALGFLDNALKQIETEPELSGDLDAVAAMRQRARQLLDFYENTERAEALAFGDSSRRAAIMFQRALLAVKAFERLEWWTNLPTDDLTPPQVHDLRERVYRAMFLLAALRLKETIPSQLNVLDMLKMESEPSRASNQAALVLFDLLDGYRRSQGSELGRKFASERMEWLTKAMSALAFQKPMIEYKARNAPDLYILGSALGYLASATDEVSRKPFEVLLGFADAESTSKAMLTQASELQPDFYWTQIVRAYFENQRGESDASWRSYLHAISLDPENWVGYARLGKDQRDYAVLNLGQDDPKRKSLLSASARHLERAADLNPASHQAFYEWGNTLTWLSSDPRQVLTCYLRALFLQEPLDGIHDRVVEVVDRASVQVVRDWCVDNLEHWNVPELYACAAWAELILQDPKASHKRAQEALNLDPGNQLAMYVMAASLSRQGRYEQAEEMFAKLDANSFRFWLYFSRAANAESIGEFESALEYYRHATQEAETDWQTFVSQKALAQLCLMAQTDDVILQLKDAISKTRTERLDNVLAKAHQFGNESAIALLQEHHQALQPITQLSSNIPVREAPLLNGSFELGLTSCWGDTLEQIDRPAWQRFGGSMAMATVDDTVVRHGDKAMHLVNYDADISSNNPNNVVDVKTYAELTQTVSVTKGRQYELSAWFYSKLGASGSVVILADDEIVLSSPVANGQWHFSVGRFVAGSSEVNIRIRCWATTDTWVDWLQMQCILTD